MELTRRSFLGIAGMAGVAAAGAGLAGCAPASTGTSAQDASNDGDGAKGGVTRQAVATYTCDVCICGAGNSGLSAAVEAAQQGARASSCWRSTAARAGGGIGTEGVFAVNSKMQQDAGIAIEPAEVIATEMSYSHNRANGLKWLDLIEASGENISWLQDCGVNFTGVVDDYHGGLFETFHWFGENRAHGRLLARHDRHGAKSWGVQFLLNCPGHRPRPWRGRRRRWRVRTEA